MPFSARMLIILGSSVLYKCIPPRLNAFAYIVYFFMLYNDYKMLRRLFVS